MLSCPTHFISICKLICMVYIVHFYFYFLFFLCTCVNSATLIIRLTLLHGGVFIQSVKLQRWHGITVMKSFVCCSQYYYFSKHTYFSKSDILYLKLKMNKWYCILQRQMELQQGQSITWKMLMPCLLCCDGFCCGGFCFCCNTILFQTERRNVASNIC